MDLLKNISNIPGWKTKRNLVVIESDDWGSIRMPSNEVFDNLIKDGIDLINDEGFIFNAYDSLATADDLSALFQVLFSIKDCNGRPALFTPVSVVANPDFEKIRQSDFTEYFYEPFSVTLSRYPGCEKTFELWKEGIKNGFFMPQFHGREHLNVKEWIKSLKCCHKKTRKAFDNGMWSISTANDPEIKVEFQAAFDFIDPDDLKYHKEVIVTGLDLFEKLFNYRASYFVPPNGTFSSELEKVCQDEGIKYLSVSKIRFEPVGNGRMTRRLHWLGQKNKEGIIYLSRNCSFEPSQPGTDWIDRCLNEISIAFKWCKPAIISSHRINYIGALHKRNRENGLKQLQILLKHIVRKWPDAEFITTDELGEIIKKSRV